MGNYISCTFIAPSIMKSAKASRVILPGGEVRQFREQVKAAEIMLECANYFIVNSRALNIGRRFSALAADEDLEFGNVYIMFPMRRVNSVVTASDMAVLLMSANSAAKRISGGKVRVIPEVAAMAAAEAAVDVDCRERENERPRLSLDDDVDGFASVVPEFKYRLSMCRSKKPMLDTITEEPLRLR